MKKKIVKVGSHKSIEKRMAGYGTFRITGPGAYQPECGRPRIVVWAKGTREFAESVALETCENNDVITQEGY